MSNKSINEFNLYIEWGFANTIIPYNQISFKLKELLKDYSNPLGGTRCDVGGETKEELRETYNFKYDLLNNVDNRHILNCIFNCLGLKENTTYDEFNKIYGGLTKEEYLNKLEK